MENLEIKNITSLINESKIEKCGFANENDLDKKILVQKNAKLCKFKNMGFLELELKSCIFQANTFIDCYFRNAKLELTSFIGSKFISCNLSGAKFINCNLEYVTFKDCAVKYDDIKESLPEKLNLRKEICKNLAMEHLKLGNTKEYKKFFFEERECSRKFHKAKFMLRDEYIKKKFNIEDAIFGIKNYILITLDKYLWGYGERLSVVLKNIFILNLLFFLYIKFFIVAGKTNDEKITFKELILNFLNISTPYLYKDNWSFIIHRALGILLCGLFITTLFRRVNKR